METLQAIYNSEINASISWNWDGGIDVSVGGLPIYNNLAPVDEASNVATIQEAVEWLKNTVIKHYPNSKFAKENQ